MKKTLILVLAIVLSLGLMACSSSGGGIKVCVGSCATNADCGMGSFCDKDGQCVGCLVDADCGSSNHGCNAKHYCNECKVDADCGLLSKGCDTATGRCKQCTKDADCSYVVGSTTTKIGTGKCGSDFSCDKCTVNADCSSNTSDKICGSGNICVACKVDADCGTGKKCYRGTFQGNDFALCFALCTSDADCLAAITSSGYKCNTGTGECVCNEAACKTSEPNSALTFSCE